VEQQERIESLRRNTAARKAAAEGMLAGFKARVEAREAVLSPPSYLDNMEVTRVSTSRETLNRAREFLLNQEALASGFAPQPQLSLFMDTVVPRTPMGKVKDPTPVVG
jgi:hypothetical protein